MLQCRLPNRVSVFLSALLRKQNSWNNRNVSHRHFNPRVGNDIEGWISVGISLVHILTSLRHKVTNK